MSVSGLYSSSYLKFKSGVKFKSPNTSNFSNSTLIMPLNYSYNYNTNDKGSHLEDINRISKIQKDKVKIKNSYHKEKNNKRELLKNVHKDILRENFKNNKSENIFMTTGTDWINLCTEQQLNRNKYHNDIHNKYVDNKFISERQNAHSENSFSSHIISQTLDLKTSNRRETLPEFIQKINYVRKGNLIKGIQIERKEQIEEKFVDKIEEIKDNIKNLKSSQDLLCQWEINYAEYVKHLKHKREIEKTKLEKLFQNQTKLEQENNYVQHHIIKQQRELENHAEKRNFLICAKEKRKELPLSFLHQIEVMEEENNIKHGVFLFSFNPKLLNKTKLSKKKRNTFNPIEQLNSREKDEMERIINYIKTDKVFESVKQFHDTVDEIKKDNLRLLDNLDKNNFLINELENENATLLKMIIVGENKFKYDINLKEGKLNEHKLKNKLLIEERDFLLHEDRLNNSEGFNNKKLKFSDDIKKPLNLIIYSKSQIILKEFQKSLNFLDLHENINNNTKNTEVEKTNFKIINMLKDVEIGLNFLLEKYKQFSMQKNNNSFKHSSNTSNNIALLEVETRLEKERKYKKAFEQKEKVEYNRNKLKVQVFENSNKIFILPKRKIVYRFKPKDNFIKKQINASNEDAKFEDFISFNEN